MLYHMIAFGLGYVLDLILGDPHNIPHPVRWIGALIHALDDKWNSEDEQKAIRSGRWMVVVSLLITICSAGMILVGAYILHPIAGIVVEAIMTYQILSIKSLKVESMKVYDRLRDRDLMGARQAVSMIVGRDVDDLDEIGVTKAAVETVAENTSDGGIAPMFYTAIGGPILGFAYKAINTMDSMVGYKNERYLHFGRCAAITDDIVNYIPSRISAYLMILACIPAGKDYNGKRAARIHKRDCRKHASPNSAQTESVCAGALGIRLAGDAVYFGKVVHKPYIGDEERPVEYEDIRRANRLLYIAAFLHWLVWMMIDSVIVLIQ